MSSSMLRVMTVFGTRPELIRLSSIVKKLDRYTEHTMVHTGQNYDFELNEVFYADLGLRKPDYVLESAGATGATTVGNVIIAIDNLLERIPIDAFLVLGDTDSSLSVIPAKRRKIPVFHMEAGNRCFDDRVPEELNRRIVDHTADVNLTYSSIARGHLLSEGFASDSVITTGSPLFEVIQAQWDRIRASTVLTTLGVETGGFILASSHRAENVEIPENYDRLVDLLNSVAEEHDVPVIVSTHPRLRKTIEKRGTTFDPRIRTIKPVSFSDYVKLETSAVAVLSDSGTITEESSILNFPALNIRETHERGEGMDEAAVMMVGLSRDRVLQGLEILRDQPAGSKRLMQSVPEYSVPNVSDKVVRIILSYVDRVNQRTWQKRRV